MAQFIPTVPGVGGALGTGLSKSLEALAQGKIKQMIEAPQRETISQILSYLAGTPSGESMQQVPGQEGAALAQQVSGQSAQTPDSAQAMPGKQQPRQLDQQTFQKLLAQLPPHLQAQAVAAYQGQQAKVAQNEKEARKEAHEQQKEINKSTQKYYDEIVARGASATQANERLDKMKNLIKKGNLPDSTFYNVLNSLTEVPPAYAAGALGAAGALAGPLGGVIGAVAGGLVNPIATAIKGRLANKYQDLEEFEKLSNEFIKDAKGIFGSRITDADLKAFMKTVPSLAQTDQGKLKIIKNIEAFNKATTAERQALEEIIEENGGKRPNNIKFLVEKRTRRKLDKLAERFEA